MANTLENRGTGVVASQVRSMLPMLADAEVRVARWLLSRSMAQVAQESGVSDTTVLRFCRSVGFRGSSDVKLAAEAAIVGTSLDRDGNTWDPVDPDRAERPWTPSGRCGKEGGSRTNPARHRNPPTSPKRDLTDWR